MCLFKNKKIKALENEITNLEYENKTFTTEIESMKKLLASLRADIETKQNKITELTGKYNELFTYKEQLLSDNLTLKNQVKELEEQVAKLKQKPKTTKKASSTKKENKAETESESKTEETKSND